MNNNNNNNNIFTKYILEYTPKVIDGELEWEPEPLYDKEDSKLLPDKFNDFKDIKHIKAGKNAHKPGANRKRDYSNTRRSFYEYYVE